MSIQTKKLREKIQNKEIVISIVGLGKIGLPLTSVFSEKGYNIIGVDKNQEIVDNINKGISHVDCEDELPKMVENSVSKNKLSATTNTIEATKKSDIIILIVPMILDDKKNADTSIIESAAEEISKGLHKDSIVIIETTMAPGTVDKKIIPILEKSGLKAGKDFGVAHCPERVSSGQAIDDITKNYPKIIGATDKKTAKILSKLYDSINNKGTILVSSIKAAETVKVFEGVYRDVNIALANELALASEDLNLDAMEIINAANTQPFCNIHKPGPGVGGHCIPVYPYFISNYVKIDTTLIKTARKINNNMSKIIRKKLEENKKKYEKISILGLAYRGGVKEYRYSPTLLITKEVSKLSKNIIIHDPLFNVEEIENITKLRGSNNIEETIKDSDGIIIVTDHKEYKDIDWKKMQNITKKGATLIDSVRIVNSDLNEISVKWIGK